jgi:hypothetical protein
MKIILTFLLLTLAVPVFSQSVDLDPKSFNLSFVNLPQQPVLERKNRTFSFAVNTGNVYDFRDAKDNLEYNVGIDGFKNVESNAYFEIRVDLWDPLVSSKEIKKIERREKDAKGVEQVYISYKAIVKVREVGSFAVVCLSDASFDKKYSLENSFTIEGLFENNLSAEKFAAETVGAVRNEYLRHVIASMDTRLNRDYGFVIEQTTDYLWILDSKKHPEFGNNAKALSNVMTVFGTMRYNEDLSPLKPQLEPAMSYLEGVDKAYAEDERKHRKLRYAAYFNLAVIYYYLDQPNESDFWCDKLMANKYDASDGQGMKIRNASLRELLAVNQVQSRHMDVEPRTNGAVEDSEVSVANFDPNYFLKNDPKYGLIRLVLTSNDTVSGYAKWSEIGSLDKKVALSIADQKGNHNYRFKTYFAEQVSKLIIAEDDFYSTVSFKEATKTSSGKPTFRFVREILNGKTISLYQYFTGEVIVKRHSEALGYSTNSVGWQMNTRTKFIELADSCPRLAARANNKEFKNEIASLCKFVEALDSCK